MDTGRQRFKKKRECYYCFIRVYPGSTEQQTLASAQAARYNVRIPMLVTFRQLFCSKHNCAERDFSRRFLEMTLYPRARSWLPVLAYFEVTSIQAARHLIEEVGDSTSEDEVDDAISEYQQRLNRNSSWITEGLKLRVSCGRLWAVYRSTMQHARTMQLELFSDQGKIISLVQRQSSPVAVDF